MKRAPKVPCFSLPRGTLWLFIFCSCVASGSVGAVAGMRFDEDSTPQLAENSAEITLAKPTHYAVMFHESGKFRTLHGRGDKVRHPREPGRFVTIERVGSGTVVIQANRGQGLRILNPGEPVPGFPELIFTETVTVTQLRYRSRLVTELLHAEPILVSLEGSRAILEVEIFRRPPAHSSHAVESGQARERSETIPAQRGRRKRGPQLFADMRMEVLDANTYKLAPEDVKPILQNINEVLSDLQPTFTPAFSARTGMSADISSAVADGVLDQGGFTVTNPKLAERFGIQEGDTILRINGSSVNSPLIAWWIYQEVMIRNPLLSVIKIDIRRGRTLVNKTYMIR